MKVDIIVNTQFITEIFSCYEIFTLQHFSGGNEVPTGLCLLQGFDLDLQVGILSLETFYFVLERSVERGGRKVRNFYQPGDQ